MKEPTKADLATAVAKLTEENAGLRDLLAAISLAADTVPVAKGGGYVDEWKRFTRVLAVIKNAAALDDWDGYLAWAAGEVRSLAAEPVGYEVHVRPEADELHAEPAPGCESYSLKGDGCTVAESHWLHQDKTGHKWLSPESDPGGPEVPEPAKPAGPGGVLFNVGDEAEPCSPDAAEALIDAIVAGTPLLVTDDEAPEVAAHRLNSAACTRPGCGHLMTVHKDWRVSDNPGCRECECGQWTDVFAHAESSVPA